MTRVMRFWRGTRIDRGRVRLVLPPLVILGFAALAAVLAAKHVAEREEQQVRRGAEQVASSVRARVEAYANVLYGVRGLFEASTHVTPRDFHRFVESQDLERRQPGAQVIGFAAVVPTAVDDLYAARLRRAYDRSDLAYPAFRPHPAPAGRRRVLVSYVEPQAGNEAAVGFDFLAEDVRRAAILRSERTGRPVATAPVTLVQERGRQKGFLVQLVTRRPDGSAEGSGYAAFRMGDLMRGILGPDARGAGLEVYDLGADTERPWAASSERLTFDGDPRRLAEVDGSRTERFEVLGRTWGVRFAPRASVLSPVEQLAPWAILAAGALLAALTGWTLRAAARTERRAVALAERMTEDLREREAELARSNADLERFAHVASHDLREPLRTVISFLGLLSRRHADRLDEDARSFVDHAVGGAHRMNALITDLLEYSRVGRTARDPEAVPLDEVLAAAQGNLSQAIEECGAELHAGPLPVVRGDRGELVQILQNLLGNALKYRSEAAPVIRIDAERRGERWEVGVADNGIGIDPRHHDRIFVPFQRLHGRGEYEGTGMGLAIVARVLERRGGAIRVESEPGRGSRFILTLPAAEAPAAEAAPPAFAGSRA